MSSLSKSKTLCYEYFNRDYVPPLKNFVNEIRMSLKNRRIFTFEIKRSPGHESEDNHLPDSSCVFPPTNEDMDINANKIVELTTAMRPISGSTLNYSGNFTLINALVNCNLYN